MQRQLLARTAALTLSRARSAAAMAVLSVAACGGGGGGSVDPGIGPDGNIVVDVPGWSRWTKGAQPVLVGASSQVGDPNVMRDGNLYRMFYTCYDPDRQGPDICQATSPDGRRFTDVATAGTLQGAMVRAVGGQWDDRHETAFGIRYRGEYLLYFVGYKDRGGFSKSFPSALGLAVSTDGVRFTRFTGTAPNAIGTDAVMIPTPGGHDNDAISSPTLIEYDGGLLMIYTGHCWSNCPMGTGISLLAATSSDGRTWTKRATPVIPRSLLPQAKDGAAEAEIVAGPDGYFYLFMSLLYGVTHDIGVARSATPFGPWDVAPGSIVRAARGQFDEVGPIAPSVLIEGNMVRLWFHGFDAAGLIRIGYAQAPWPLKLQ